MNDHINTKKVMLFSLSIFKRSFHMFFRNKTSLQKAYPFYADFLCSGLGNPGNLCYLNSLLQTFASSSQWTHFFNKTAGTHPVLQELANLINSLREPFSVRSSLSTKYVRQLFSKINISSSANRQQDFHEFYMKVLVSIEKLFHQSVTINLSNFSTLRIFPAHIVYKESITCSLCHHMVCQISQESSIILGLQNGSLSLALQEYFGPVTLTSQCPHCGRTNNRTLTRRMIFPPKNILFFISRVQFAEVPSTSPFSYPAYIDMTQFCFAAGEMTKKDDGLLKMALGGISEAIQDGKNGYELTSVVAFHGRENSGHYLAYRVHRETSPPYAKRWVCASDNSVKPVTLEDVINANKQAILLNYEIVRNED
ncbi:Clan CA, family C19, ubiquitin hydrolase-like cysteine peptidase [Tritrichomonas foetus]|uniref:Clan CA, family C19, ubiquitin hydrolase-like cysteine peptidase n=1 Tax=Tritrichomonas foetus TaxID=1144522 RepID=A0A1J4J5V2_9EUKA|nr:Clan CA, family C19, ubiquitin hydrolase-like cysteine peptidase [Tritrichomonas foetus]|eukprot:OHS93027.1 Clan CA, family C19, ubiquitin hydrolase-like cysteine peptidase [Tritrichomonas foetus]